MEFHGFGKIPRLSRDMTITEKIDGTSAQIRIVSEDTIVSEVATASFLNEYTYKCSSGLYLIAGSRNRYLKPGADNHGFARWAWDNAEELVKLGEGRHFGEWWGKGIQHGYGLNEKRFSLFNSSIWKDDSVRPICCHVVPELYSGPFNTDAASRIINVLEAQGSFAAPGCMKPEGIIIYHVAANRYFKKTIKNDESPKSKVEIN